MCNWLSKWQVVQKGTNGRRLMEGENERKKEGRRGE